MKVKSLMLFVVLAAVFTMALAPMGQEEGPVLTEAQLVVIGLVASALTWGIKVAVSKGWQPKKEHVAIGLYVVSFVLAIAFTSLTFPAFPPFTDAPSFVTAVLQYIGLLLAIASPVAGMAYLVYNVLVKRVLEYIFPAAKA